MKKYPISLKIYFKIKEKIRDEIRFSNSKMTLTAFLLSLTVGKFLKGSANVKVPQRILLSGFPRSLELFVLSDSQLRSRDAQFVWVGAAARTTMEIANMFGQPCDRPEREYPDGPSLNVFRVQTTFPPFFFFF